MPFIIVTSLLALLGWLVVGFLHYQLVEEHFLVGRASLGQSRAAIMDQSLPSPPSSPFCPLPQAGTRSGPLHWHGHAHSRHGSHWGRSQERPPHWRRGVEMARKVTMNGNITIICKISLVMKKKHTKLMKFMTDQEKILPMI